MQLLNNPSATPEIFTTVRQIGTFFYVDSTGQLLLMPGKSNADTMTLPEVVQTLSEVPGETPYNRSSNTEVLLRRITFVAFGIISLFVVNHRIASAGSFTAFQYWMYTGLAGVIGLYAGAVTTDLIRRKIEDALITARDKLAEVQWIDSRMSLVLFWRCFRDILITAFVTVLVLASFGFISLFSSDATTFFTSYQPSVSAACFDVIGMWLLWVVWNRAPIHKRIKLMRIIRRAYRNGTH